MNFCTLFIFIVIRIYPGLAENPYLLNMSYSGSHFFNDWIFYTDNDTAGGIVDYVNLTTALSMGMITYPNGKVHDVLN
jgi:hypothetical protein